MKEANRKLERAVLRGDSFMFSCALSEGASIGYKSGAFFNHACMNGHLEIVEMFLLDHTFISKGKSYYKTLTNPSFHQGLTSAIARGHVQVVDFLIDNKTYNKLPGLNNYIIDGIEAACNNQKIDMIHLILSKKDLLNNEDFKNKYINWPPELKDTLEQVMLNVNLTNTLGKKEHKKAKKL